MKKVYLFSMATAFVICLVAFVRFSFPGDGLALFHVEMLNGFFGVTLHSVLNTIMLFGLLWVFFISWRNCLSVVDVKHSTVLSKK